MNETRERPKLLVIDDSSFVRRLTKARLEAEGCDVTTAQDGGEGLHIGLSRHFDVVVVDGKLPVVNGTEICRRLATLPSERRPRIIFHSATVRSFTERQEAFTAGADAVLVKEPAADNLIATVLGMLSTREVPATAMAS